jgi:septum formation protein
MWDPTDDPETTVLGLAQGKAWAVAIGREDEYVLGCDSLLVFDGTLYGKPGSREDARRRWHAMAGRSGTLVTGHALVHQGRTVGEAVATTVTFLTPTDAELEAYLDSGEPLNVAGGFTLEGRSSPFIGRIEGDASNVTGLSMAALRRLFGEFGVSISTVWR